MDVDASFEALGGFGLIQTFNFMIYALACATSGWFLTGVSFTLSEPDGYRCSLPPGTENDTISSGAGAYDAEQCSLVYNGSVGGDNETTSCLYGWEFDSLHGETSYATDVNLICDRTILLSTLISIHFGGALFGAFILGQLSDRLGRRLVVLGSQVGLVATGVGLSFVWNYALMGVLRFLHGMFIPGPLLFAYVRMVEMLTQKQRLRGCLVMAVIWVMGILVLAPMAYLIPNWRHLQLTMSLLNIPLIPLLWSSYESIRWLVQKGRVEEAEKILRKLAKSKNIPTSIPALTLHDPNLDVSTETAKWVPLEQQPKPEPDKENDPLDACSIGLSLAGGRPKEKTATILDLLTTRAMCLRTLIVCYCWFANSVVYYGFYINIGFLVGNKYINFFLLSLTELPSYVIDFFVMTRFGRRHPLIAYYLISGVACLATGFIPSETGDGMDLSVVILVFALIGKGFTSSAFDVAYLYTAELFPTILRNTAVGAASVMGRVGSMVAPFVVYLNVYHSSIPLIVFSVVSVIAGLLVIPLPDTHNRPLVETLGNGVNFAMKPLEPDYPQPQS